MNWHVGSRPIIRKDLPEDCEDAELAVVPIMKFVPLLGAYYCQLVVLIFVDACLLRCFWRSLAEEAGIVESYLVIEIPHLRLLSTITEGWSFIPTFSSCFNSLQLQAM